jgi:hypothetical protein
MPILLEVPPLELTAVQIHAPRLNGATLRARMQFGPPPGMAAGRPGGMKPRGSNVATPESAADGPQVVPPRAAPTAARPANYRVVRGGEGPALVRKTHGKRAPERIPDAAEAAVGLPPLIAPEMIAPGMAEPAVAEQASLETPSFRVLEDEPSLRGRLIRSLSLWIKTGNTVLLIGAALAASMSGMEPASNPDDGRAASAQEIGRS